MSIEHDLRAVAEAVRGRIQELVASIAHTTAEQVPELYGKDPVLAETESPSITDALTSILDGLSGGRRVPERASEAALREARVAAQAGIDLQKLIRTYRIGQSIMWGVLLEETLAALDSDERRMAVLKQISDYQYAWNDKVTESVIAAYQAEHDAYFLRSQDRKRRAIVSDILRGLPSDTPELGYNVRTTHLALVAWGRSPEANIRAIAAALGARALVVSGTSGTYLAWLGDSNIARSLEERPEAVAAMTDTYLALGEVEQGLEGFRLSHRQAWQAYRVSRLRPRDLTRYPEVALESLMLKDPQAVRDFVARELRVLSEGGSRAEVLRSTLKAYFQSSQNAAATASAIHVHERTVAYRLRSIESHLGVPISARRDELAVALRLSDLIDDPDNQIQARDDVVETEWIEHPI